MPVERAGFRHATSSITSNCPCEIEITKAAGEVRLAIATGRIE
jgi:hypothetical protein